MNPTKCLAFYFGLIIDIKKPHSIIPTPVRRFFRGYPSYLGQLFADIAEITGIVPLAS
jgi:hypothetical protein